MAYIHVQDRTQKSTRKEINDKRTEITKNHFNQQANHFLSKLCVSSPLFTCGGQVRQDPSRHCSEFQISTNYIGIMLKIVA